MQIAILSRGGGLGGSASLRLIGVGLRLPVAAGTVLLNRYGTAALLYAGWESGESEAG